MLVNFVAELTSFPKEAQVAPKGKPCQVYVDRLFYQAGGGVGVHIITEHGDEHDYVIKLTFKMTKIEVEYKALLARILVARLLGATKLK